MARRTHEGVISALVRNSSGLSGSQTSYRRLFDRFSFPQRLQKQFSLDGHSGCVNTISWNETGDLLLSGSDDRHLNIYNIWQEKLLFSILSGHRANILSAAFLPCTSDTKTVSCSSDGMVRENDFSATRSSDVNGFCCHIGTVYQVLVVSGEANTFFSCGEDGIVRQYDLRQSTSCSCPNGRCQVNIAIRNSKPISCMSVNPIMPYQLAIGSSDGFIKIYDRRNLSTSNSENENSLSKPICAFVPSKLANKEEARLTSLTFSSRGNEILASYRADGVYLYSLDHNNYNSSSNQTEGETCPGTRNISSNREPSTKRLRLLGDWSDTGPDALPFAERSWTEQHTNESVTERMNSLFNNWYEESFSFNADDDYAYDALQTSQMGGAASVSRQMLNAVDASNVDDESMQPNDTNRGSLHAESEAASTIQRFFRKHCKPKSKCKDNNREDSLIKPKLLMKFEGHRNARTMIQQANFFGDSFVISGSDCGHAFIWNKQSGKLVAMFLADQHVVNCLQPHPCTQVLATSGIDNDIKIWAPTSAVPMSLDNANEVIRRNEAILSESQNFLTVPGSFIFRMLVTSVANRRAARREQSMRQQETAASSNDPS